MSYNVAQFMIGRLADWGVTRVYAYPGAGIRGLVGAFHEMGGRLRFIQVRHEEIAAFAATGHAKFTGEVGVCMATSGPGAIHLLNGLYDGQLDHQPVVAIVGQQRRRSLGCHYQQEVDLQALFKDVAHEYVHYCMVPQQAGHLIDRAVRIAKATRSVTCVIVPVDVQLLPHEEPPRERGAVETRVAIAEPRVLPREEDLSRAARVLNAGERVAILVGQGALAATDEVIEVAEILGAGVAKALNGRAAVPDDLPFVTGSIGMLGTKPSDRLMSGCDTLLMVGSSFPYPEWLPKEGQARGVQIDIDGRMVGIRYPVEVSLVGDAADTLRALIPHLQRKQARSWRQEIQQEVARWWEILEALAHHSAEPVNPQLVFHELSSRLPDDCIVTADSGSGTNWWARHLRFRRGMMAALSGNLATMCPALPYALAAKFAYPDRVAIATMGDGAFLMLGMNTLVDVARYWREWSDPRLIILVLNNRDLNLVTWEQRMLAGNPKLEASQVLPDFPHARFAELLGLKGIRVDSPDQVAEAWEQALAADRPVLYEAVTDPEVPSLPPHIRVDFAKRMGQAMLKGDPGRGAMVRHLLRGKLQELIRR